MKVTKLIYGEGWTKNIVKNEKPFKVYNEAEYILNGETDLKSIHMKLRDEVALLNQKELEKYLEN